MKNLVGIFFAVLMLFLAACSNESVPTPKVSDLAAPANITVASGDGLAVISWDVVADERAAAYNVYQDGEQVNNAPIKVPDLSIQAFTQLSYTVLGLENGKSYEFAVSTLDKLGQESPLAEAKKATPSKEKAKPDLKVELTGPAVAAPGQDISGFMTVLAKNLGSASAFGTASANTDGYMIDLVLSTDTTVAPGFAVFSPNFSEDVLLQGGRISNTPDLAVAESQVLSEGSMTLPSDTPEGAYYLCAQIDAGQKIAELDENNNLNCVPFKVAKEQTEEKLPDLIVKSASIKLAETCQPYSPILYVTATVANIGNAASPERLDVGLVNSLDTHGNNWGNGKGLHGINPGEAETVTFPIYYLIADPEHMEGVHSFDVVANRGNWITESDTSNNSLSPDLKITVPAGFCKTSKLAQIAIIHSTDKTAAESYKTGLESRDFYVDLINVADLTADSIDQLKGYDALIIDTFSGYLSNWDGSADAITAILKSKRPVLGLGEGGYAFLAKLSSAIGWPQGWHGSEFKGFDTTSPVHPALLGSRPVGIESDFVYVTSSPMSYVSIYLPEPESSLELVGREVGNDSHYPVVVDAKAKTAIWGAHGVPSDYTEDGWNALANLVDYMIALP